MLSFWFRPGLKTWRSIFVACVFDLDHCVDQTGSKRRSELSPSGICCQLPPLAALQTARIQVAACWRSKDSAQRHGLEDWDQSTDSLSGEERVARGLSVVLCQVVVWSSLYHSRRTRRGWSSGLQRLLIVIRVFFFSFPFLAFPTFLTTYTQDTFCLLPPFFDFCERSRTLGLK